jgi:FecR protein
MTTTSARLAIGLLSVALAAGAAAQDKAGLVVSAAGEVAALGANRNSRVELRFADEARFVLGPDSELTVGQYRYKRDAEDNSMVTNLARGVFRFFSGLMAKKHPQSVRIVTPVATIGIRGTHVVGEVTATSATVALAQPEEAGRKTAIEVSNQYGSVVIDKPGYETNIPDAHSPPSPPRRVQTQRIDNLLRSIQTIRRITVPRQPPRLPN